MTFHFSGRWCSARYSSLFLSARTFLRTKWLSTCRERCWDCFMQVRHLVYCSKMTFCIESNTWCIFNDCFNNSLNYFYKYLITIFFSSLQRGLLSLPHSDIYRSLHWEDQWTRVVYRLLWVGCSSHFFPMFWIGNINTKKTFVVET